jgi:glycosyltransferase involved in cell wall biosynthesis
MVRPDLSKRTATERAVSELAHMLDREAEASRDVTPTVSVDEALRGAPALELSSQRDITRVLFISRNADLLNPTEQSLDGFIKVSDLFEEVHILILRQGIPPKNPVLRVAPNVWIYTAAARNWWWTWFAGIRLMEQELVFAGGFRPDLIVARDPFECAYVAHVLGKRFSRPTQLHILEDYTTREFTRADRHNRWRRYVPRFLVSKFLSVRTHTHALRDYIERKFTIPDLDVLPRFRNYDAIMSYQATVDLKSIYKPFMFIMLYIGRLSFQSTLYRAIDAARFVLKNPHVGLVVLGDGEARREFEKRATILGIEKQVVFERRQVDETAYLHSAHMLLVTDTDEDANEVALRGAAAGIPMVLAMNEVRSDLFTHATDALMFTQDDVQQCTDAIHTLLNDLGMREQLSRNVQNVILNHFHDDAVTYRTAYRASIESALFVVDDTSTSTS